MKTNFIISVLLLFIAYEVNSQTIQTREKGGFSLQIFKDIQCTAVKNQASSGTCWSFSTQSFLESELNRLGKGNYDLSEMYVVRCIYYEKAVRYIRMLGNTNFGAGGEPGDVLYCMRKYGLMPQQAYPGNVVNNRPNHNEVDEVLHSFVKSIVKLKAGTVSNHWQDALNGILDAYFGKIPASFAYEGKTYTPISFSEHIGLQQQQYMLVSSFTHVPYYKPFILEVPDNWTWDSYQNFPLDEMEAMVDYAIEHNYSVALCCDVSEKGFSFKNGVAIVPEKSWEEMNEEERNALYTKPCKQMQINDSLRQYAFNSLATQDDHAMHIVGIAYDDMKQKYYKVKNSWGANANDTGGYIYISASYFRYKTTSICLNMEAIAPELLKKCKK